MCAVFFSQISRVLHESPCACLTSYSRSELDRSVSQSIPVIHLVQSLFCWQAVVLRLLQWVQARLPGSKTAPCPVLPALLQATEACPLQVENPPASF